MLSFVLAFYLLLFFLVMLQLDVNGGAHKRLFLCFKRKELRRQHMQLMKRIVCIIGFPIFTVTFN